MVADAIKVRPFGQVVIVRELARLLGPNHMRVFTSFLHAYLSDWRERGRWKLRWWLRNRPFQTGSEVVTLATLDGNTLVFNIHCSSLRNPPIAFPDDEITLHDHFASLLYQMSSVLPPHLREAAGRRGISRL